MSKIDAHSGLPHDAIASWRQANLFVDFALLEVDLDKLALQNVANGPVATTALVVAVASLLKDIVPAEGQLSHVGAGRFQLVVVGQSAAALAMAETIRQAIEAAYSQGRITAPITTCVALAFSSEVANLVELRKLVQQRTHAAKVQGRNRVVTV